MPLIAPLLIGTIVALFGAAVLLWFDIGGIATLIAGSPAGALALFLLIVGLVTAFGPVAIAFGPSPDDDPPSNER